MHTDVHDLFRRLGSDFFDVHAAGRRTHEGDPPRATINQRTEIEFAVDLSRPVHIDGIDRQTCAGRLMCTQHAADHVRRHLTHVVHAIADLDPAGLAAAAGVDLSLDHPACSTQCAGRLYGFVSTVRNLAFAGGYAETGKYVLGLKFVNVHRTAFLKLTGCAAVHGPRAD